MNPSDTERSKYLSYLLRHKPEAAHLTLDKEGWCLIDQLLMNTDFTLPELTGIVAADEKGRYSFDASATSVRANQGHSTSSVSLIFSKAIPPVVLYHGTKLKTWEIIKKQGLLPMKRHYVHLTASYDTAVTVSARRKGDLAILTIDAKQMLADDVQFYLSDNGVWLVNTVNPKYIHLDQT